MEMRKLIEALVREGVVLEIDGRGCLELDAQDNLVFRRNDPITVFLAYAQEDLGLVKKLYAELQEAGFEPWMDKERLLPGQNWPRAIERAIEASDFFLACFSSRSINKRGHFQSELGYAMTAAARVPEEDTFFIPARLNDCRIPQYVLDQIHCVDLFPDWDAGLKKLTAGMTQLHRRNRKDPG